MTLEIEKCYSLCVISTNFFVAKSNSLKGSFLFIYLRGDKFLTSG